jgi:hypothetical protein
MILVPFAIASARADSSENSRIQLIQASQRQNLESIKSIHVKMRFQPGDKNAAYTGPLITEWWQKGDHVRYVVDYTDRTEMATIIGLEQKWFAKYPRPSAASYVTGYVGPKNEREFISPWFCGMILYETGAPPSDELSNRTYKVNLSRDEATGQEVAELVHRDFSVRLWFDPKRAYLLGKQQQYSKTREITAWHEVKSFREAKPGIYFPVQVDHLDKNGNTVLSITFTDVQINEPIVESIFSLAFPEGSSVTNGYTKQTYVVGKDERAVTEPSPMPENNAADLLYRYQTNDPRARSFWARNRTVIIWAGVAVGALTVLGASLMVRRHRLQSGASS